MTGSFASTNGASATSDQRQSNFTREKQQRLLQDPKFRLLKVEHGETRIDEYRTEIKSLKVVTPAFDPTIAEDAKREGWYCLSHLWGDPAEWIVWDDANVFDGDTGECIKAKVLSNKRDQIMSFLQEHAGYWWIDIFCAQSDTPLVIVGDIYKVCLQCFTSIDLPCETFYGELQYGFRHAVSLSASCLEQAADGYLDMINKTNHKDDISAEWMQVLKDLLHWPSTHFEEIANLELIAWKDRHSKTPRAQQLFDSLLYHPIDERIAAAQKFFNGKECNRSDFYISDKEFMKHLQAYTPENLIRAQQDAAKFLNCRWMNRVWTLQELALPRLISLSSGGSTTYSFQTWTMYFMDLLKVIAKAFEIRETTSMDRQSTRERGTAVQTPREVLNYYQKTDPVLARIYSDYRKMLEMVIVLGYNSAYRWEDNENLMRRIILNSFTTSERKALCPEDYVYGVLGILDITIGWHVSFEVVGYLCNGAVFPESNVASSAIL